MYSNHQPIRTEKITERDGFLLVKLAQENPETQINDYEFCARTIRSILFSRFSGYELIHYRNLILILDVLEFIFGCHDIIAILCDTQELTKIFASIGVLMTKHPEDLAIIYNIHFSKAREAKLFLNSPGHYVILTKKDHKTVVDRNYYELLDVDVEDETAK